MDNLIDRGRLFAATESAYVGKDGCACGCNGDYARTADVDDAPLARRRVNRALKLWETSSPLYVFYWPGRKESELYVAVRTGGDRDVTRILALYVRPAEIGLAPEACETLESLADGWTGSVLDLIHAAAEVSK